MIAIADAIAAGSLEAEIAVVISDRPSAAGLEAARARGLDTVAAPAKGLTREAFEERLASELTSRSVDLICLAGFMRILGPDFICRFPEKILNIHPSLLPAFPGLDAQKQALEHGVKISGCTVHYVDQGLDSGPIVLQAAVPVDPNDTEATLSGRILAAEHRLYPEAIGLVLSAKARILGRRVVPPSEP